MKTNRKRSFFKVVVLTFLTTGCLVSCNQNEQNGTSVHEMQVTLDSIMQDYHAMQDNCDNYAKQLSERDSAIEAQAAEIQNLIDQLNGKGTPTTTTRTVTKTNKAQVRKLRAQLEAKKAEIAHLQSRLDQMNTELNDIKAVDGYADRETIARLQRLVREQDVRIVALSNDKVRLTNTNDSLTAHIAYLLGQRNVEIQSTPSSTDYAAQVALLQNQVSSQQAEIARLQEEVAKQTALVAEANTAAEKAKAEAAKSTAQTKSNAAKTKGSINKKLAELQALCDEYYEELQRLRAENVILRNENDSLRSEVVAYKKNAENTAVENAKMAAKVTRASILSADPITVTPLKRLSNGTGRPTSRATATSAFRVEGTLLSNSVIEPGTVTIYAVITSPSNNVLHNGTMEQKFDANGTRTTYTTVQSYEFTGDERTFEMSWSKDDDTELESGIYRVSLYANSSLIGFTEFKLK